MGDGNGFVGQVGGVFDWQVGWVEYVIEEGCIGSVEVDYFFMFGVFVYVGDDQVDFFCGQVGNVVGVGDWDQFDFYVYFFGDQVGYVDVEVQWFEVVVD